MSEHDHDEIARRLRETGTVPAPERLQGEVMDQVRAEPRLRPARRSLLMPVMPYAAVAAAVLAVAVLALTHFGGSGSHSGSAGGTGAEVTSGGGSRTPSADSAGVGGGQPLAPTPSGVHTNALGVREFHVAGRYVQSLAPLKASPTAQTLYPRAIVLFVPRRQYAAYVARFRFFEHHSGANASVRVILRPAR